MNKPELQKYEPTFVIDDGFRLASEPTLDAICNDVRKWYDFALKGADMHLLGAFLCGVSLLRAKKLVPAAPRGMHGHQTRYSGFDGWKRATFPDSWERTLGRYMQLSAAVFECAKSKKDTLSFLGGGPDGFELPSTRSDVADLMREIGEAMDGKTMTAMYRSIKRIREALPTAEYRGKLEDRTRPKGEKQREEALEEIAAGWGTEAVPGRMRKWMLWFLAPLEVVNVKPIALMESEDLDELAELTHDLYREICDLRAARGGKRK